MESSQGILSYKAKAVNGRRGWISLIRSREALQQLLEKNSGQIILSGSGPRIADRPFWHPFKYYYGPLDDWGGDRLLISNLKGLILIKEDGKWRVEK